VIELKRGEVPEVVLNNLYKSTQLQDTFGMNMVALVDGQPRLLNLRQMLECFLSHRREVVTRRTVFELRKARERGHLLEGLAVALANVDEMIALIKAAPTPPVAKERLLARTWDPGLAREMVERAAAGEEGVTLYRVCVRSAPKAWIRRWDSARTVTGCPRRRPKRF
jgi:DNA gyrase subunit A